MKKAFKSSTIQDQQVVSKNSIPNPVADIYNQSDKPPPLSILTPYRYVPVVPEPLQWRWVEMGGRLERCSAPASVALKSSSQSENSNCSFVPIESS